MESTEIIITQNILGQVKVELRMDDLCWSKLKKSAAWKEVYQSLVDSHQHIQEQAKVKEAQKCASLAELNAKKLLTGKTLLQNQFKGHISINY